jgi:hypothetical protein
MYVAQRRVEARNGAINWQKCQPESTLLAHRGCDLLQSGTYQIERNGVML